MVEYTYNTWGKKVTTTGSMAETLGRWQPFRWRGYVYDHEWGMYYLQSRYYDPTTGRFISADTLLSTGQGVLGHNAFAYCLDNPVRFRDSQGSDAEDTIDSGSDIDWFDSLYELLKVIGNKLNRLTSIDNCEYGCYLYMLDGKY